jgi:hypothetical protein
VARQIVFAEIRFGFDDPAAGDAVVGMTFEKTTQQVTRDQLRVARIKVAGERRALH